MLDRAAIWIGRTVMVSGGLAFAAFLSVHALVYAASEYDQGAQTARALPPVLRVSLPSPPSRPTTFRRTGARPSSRPTTILPP